MVLDSRLRGNDGGRCIRHSIAHNSETRDVDQFAINLGALAINWDRRVVLRINGAAFELTRKKDPILHLARTPTGGWDAVED